jgi:hypothetical protein
VPIGRRSQAGQISVRNSAMPKLIGKAISSAMKEVARVPTMAISAPYLSLTGSHSTVVMKAGPNSLKAGQAPMNQRDDDPHQHQQHAQREQHGHFVEEEILDALVAHGGACLHRRLLAAAAWRVLVCGRPMARAWK